MASLLPNCGNLAMAISRGNLAMAISRGVLACGVCTIAAASQAEYRPPPDRFMVEAIDRPAEHVQPLDGERDLQTWQSLPQPRIEVRRSATDAILRDKHDCDFQGLATKTGTNLVEHIRSMSLDCVNRLFTGYDDSAPEHLLLATFQASNQIVVAAAARRLAATYDGTNSSKLHQLFFYLRAGSFVRFNNPKHFDREDEVTAALKEAIDAFVANEHYYDESDEHASILADVHLAMDKVGLRSHYISLIPARLKWWRPRHAENYDLLVAMHLMFLILFNADTEPEFEAAIATNDELVEALRDFALDSRMIDTEAEFLTANAARELARLLQYDLPIYPHIRTAVRQILERYSATGFGTSIWVAAATSASLDDCAYYEICGFEVALEAHVLSGRHFCDETLLIRSENLSENQLDNACALLARQERIFYRRLGIDPGEPLLDDFNVNLEVVVFADYDSYATYSWLFFGNDTNNGGIYLEGHPSQPDSTARFIAFVVPHLPGQPIWNLEHEHIHYLDGRFNMRGGFSDYRVYTHNTVWWLEGLAEYLSKRDDNQAAADLARTGEMPLHTLFETTYDHNQTRVYRWGYLASRFFFERHGDDVEAFLRFFRAGDYDGYRSYLAGIGPRYEGEWRDWLKKEVDVLTDTVAEEYVPDATLTTFENAETTTTLDISNWFAGFDARPHEVTATISNPEVAKISLKNGRLTIVAVAPGTATVTVRAGNLWSVTTQSLQVTVTDECPRHLCPSFNHGWRLLISTGSAAARSAARR